MRALKYTAFALLLSILTEGCLTASRSLPKTPENQGFALITASFDLGDRSKFDFIIKSVAGGELLVVQYDKLDRASAKSVGHYYSISSDGGAQFGPEHPVADLSPRGEVPFSTVNFMPSGNTILAVGFRGRNAYLLRFDQADQRWTPPAQINDEQDSVRGAVSCVEREFELFCIWSDGRRGFPLVYFSGSADRGRTWSPNRPIEHDFREGNQTMPEFVVTAGGRLLVCWEDWRDRRTLVDVRCSHSDDRGRHWTPSARVNDDREHVWQNNLTLVARGNMVAVAFQDFRDPGEAGDNDWNIYLARSDDGGASWYANRRINDVPEGADLSPRLAIDSNGDLICVWTTRRNSIFGQIAASHSRDDGRSWSRSTVLTRPSERIEDLGRPLRSLNGGRLLMDRIKDDRRTFEYISRSDRDRSEFDDHKTEPVPTPPEYRQGTILFEDDFSGPDLPRWQPIYGVWMLTGDGYMGVNPADQDPFVSLARFTEPDRYLLRGRFKLDPVSHYMSLLVVRAIDDVSDAYVIRNHFRLGTWIALSKGSSLIRNRAWEETVLAERRYPFQSNRWYAFSVVLTPERIDYYVDGVHMLSHTGKQVLPPGRFGVGGAASAPTYFDDIVVSELEE